MQQPVNRTTLLTRWGFLKTERSSWIGNWSDITRFLLPRSGRYFIQDRNLGNKRYNNILDSTSTRSLRVLSAGLMSGLTSPARPWFRLQTSDPDLMKYQPVKIWLNQVTNIMLAIFARSNTYRALHSMYDELGAFGTGASIMLPDFDNVIHHYPLTAGEYAIATNWKGEVDTLYREFEKPVSQIVREFGLKNVSITVKNLYDRGMLDAWIPIVHAIEPRYDRDASKLDSQNMAWRSTYFEYQGSPDTFLSDSGFNDFPVLAPRWALSGGDIYGNSPAMEALGDIKQLQHEQLRKGQGIDFMTNPPLQVPTSLKNKEFERLPGGVTYADAPGSSKAIQSMFDVQLDLNHLLADIQDVRERIRSSFYADLFMMLSQSDDPRMTATEVAERHEEKLLMLGPVLERLQNELLDPLIEYTFKRIMDAGIAPPPPQELQDHAINVELVSMLAQAQRAIGANSIDRFVGNLGAIAQFKPNVLYKFDEFVWADKYADSQGIDPELIVDTETAKQNAQAAADAQQQMAQQQMANQAADTAQKLSNTNTANKDSALADVTRGYSGYT